MRKACCRGLGQSKGVPSVMRDVHDSSLCGESRGGVASAEARRWTEPVWQLSDRPRHPFGPLIPSLRGAPTLAGRGGSVSRRDHDQLTEERVQLSWVRKLVGKLKFIPSYSSGGGPGEALLLEKRPPPEFSLS